MRPDVDTLVVDHEQTLGQFARGVKIDAIAFVYLVVFLHEVGSCVKVANKGRLWLAVLAGGCCVLVGLAIGGLYLPVHICHNITVPT